MPDLPPFDLISANRYFAAECFNSAWELMDKPSRTAAENEQMLLRAFASFFHWTQRPECSVENRSVSLWQLARIFALIGQPDAARRYGEQCRAETETGQLPPFYLGYAYEALARAEMVAGQPDKMQAWLHLARQSAAAISGDDEARDMLIKDLESIQL